MQVDVIETVARDSDPQPDGNKTKLILVVDKEWEITVFGYGSGLYRLEVRDLANNGQDVIARELGYHKDTREQDVYTAAFWGQGLVWAEPITIAHLVHDVLTGQ